MTPMAWSPLAQGRIAAAFDYDAKLPQSEHDVAAVARLRPVLAEVANAYSSTPLAVVLSHTELALSRDRSPEEYRKTIETCNNAASRMKSLVESLLLLSHADVGELALQPVPMDLSDVVRDNVNLLTTLAGARSITLATQLQNAVMIGDPFRMAQVVANLLSNAIKYNQDGGSIAITTEVLLGDAVLTVADTGTGISAEDQKHVFDRFSRCRRWPAPAPPAAAGWAWPSAKASSKPTAEASK